MNKFALLKIVNPILFLSFIVQAVTGIAMSKGIGADYMMQISDTHKFNGMLMLVLVAIHIYLNWAWIKTNIFKRAA